MRWILTTALSLVVALLPAQAAGHADSTTMTIRLWSTGTSSRVLLERAPSQKISNGDVVYVGSILRNAVAQFGRPKGAVVGNDTAIFTVRSSTHADVIVQSTLPRGWLQAAGRVRFGAVQTYRVTDGTGRFENARGTGESRALRPNGNRRLKVYRIRFP